MSSPEWGALIATGSKDGTARLWRATDGRCVMTLRGHLDSVNAVAFSPEQYYMATASSDSTSKVWSTLTGKVLRTFAEHNREVTAVAFSPDGSKVMTGGSDARALIWAPDTGKWVKPGALQPHHGAVTSVAWAPRGHQEALMLTGSRDKNARTWNTWGAEAKVFSGHQDEVTGVAWAPDGSTVATASEQGCAKIWQWATGTCITTCEGHEDAVMTVAYSPDSRCLATGSADGTAKVWNLHGECMLTLKGHEEEVTSVAFSPDGTCLATASLDGTARVWDMGTARCVMILRGHEEGLTSVAFQPRDHVVPVPIMPLGDAGEKESDMSLPERRSTLSGGSNPGPETAMGSSKPRGIRSARKLVNRRRSQLWADKDYKKANLGTKYKCNPFGGTSHAKGIVVEKIGIEAKQPNSAIRKCCRVQLIKNGKKIAAFVPRDGCLNFIDENDEVLIAGFGRRGHAVGDIPGVRFKVVKVAGCGLGALYREKKEKPRS